MIDGLTKKIVPLMLALCGTGIVVVTVCLDLEGETATAAIGAGSSCLVGAAGMARSD